MDADVRTLARKPPLAFTEEESEQAYEQWKATCGPHAIAAAAHRSLEDVRSALRGYRGYMSPTEIRKTLLNLEIGHTIRVGLKTRTLCEGVSRIQWEGPWMRPGRERDAYRHTHYVAFRSGWVFCTAIPERQWFEHSLWESFIDATQPPWHVTHHFQFSWLS